LQVEYGWPSLAANHFSTPSTHQYNNDRVLVFVDNNTTFLDQALSYYQKPEYCLNQLAVFFTYLYLGRWKTNNHPDLFLVQNLSLHIESMPRRKSIDDEQRH